MLRELAQAIAIELTDTMETSNMSDPETLDTSARVNNVQIEVKNENENQKKVLILELNVQKFHKFLKNHIKMKKISLF